MAGVTVTQDNFEEEVKNADKPVLVDFWADWCHPCHVLSPIIEDIAKEHKDEVKVAKVDVDANQELAQQFGIMSIPTVILFKDGEPSEQWVGVQDKDTYVKAIAS